MRLILTVLFATFLTLPAMPARAEGGRPLGAVNPLQAEEIMSGYAGSQSVARKSVPRPHGPVFHWRKVKSFSAGVPRPTRPILRVSNGSSSHANPTVRRPAFHWRRVARR